MRYAPGTKVTHALRGDGVVVESNKWTLKNRTRVQFLGNGIVRVPDDSLMKADVGDSEAAPVHDNWPPLAKMDRIELLRSLIDNPRTKPVLTFTGEAATAVQATVEFGSTQDCVQVTDQDQFDRFYNLILISSCEFGIYDVWLMESKAAAKDVMNGVADKMRIYNKYHPEYWGGVPMEDRLLPR